MTICLSDLAANLGLDVCEAIERALSGAADTVAACSRVRAALGAAKLHPGDADALTHWLVRDRAGRLPWA